MPCYHEPIGPPVTETEALKKRLSHEEYYVNYYRKHLDKVTKMLCSIGKRLKKRGLLSALTPKQLNWIEKHEEWDRLCKENKRRK